MLLKPQPLADQFASLRAAAEADQAQAWLPASLHALIAACFARLFARLEQLVLLWQSGQLPHPPVNAPHPARHPVPARPRSSPRASSAKLDQAARLSTDEENQGQCFAIAEPSRATEDSGKSPARLRATAEGRRKPIHFHIFKVQGLGPWWVPVLRLGAATATLWPCLAMDHPKQ